MSPDYLRVLRVPLLRGRHLTSGDRASAPLVALVNDAAAAALGLAGLLASAVPARRAAIVDPLVALRHE